MVIEVCTYLSAYLTLPYPHQFTRRTYRTFFCTAQGSALHFTLAAGMPRLQPQGPLQDAAGG